ncbi:Secreted RxLR effector peptide protein [Phytophthora cinnamomi]|uniref:Secreted RxLR effector peptide protein n=1 Tax=Phytophthora cinnamomi TaxID=4785 RepID=UPI00355AB02D|nr:Secreted RxLR effector peptide protein [Phytophthora cinnamomi]
MFTSAERAAIPGSERNLRAQEVGGLTDKADNIAAKFLETLRKDAMLTKAEKYMKAENFKAAGVWKDTAGAVSRLSKDQKAHLTQLIQLAKKEPEEVSQMLAEVAKNDPKKWSILKKTIFGLLGATLGGSIIYGAIQYGRATAPATTA